MVNWVGKGERCRRQVHERCTAGAIVKPVFDDAHGWCGNAHTDGYPGRPRATRMPRAIRAGAIAPSADDPERCATASLLRLTRLASK